MLYTTPSFAKLTGFSLDQAANVYKSRILKNTPLKDIVLCGKSSGIPFHWQGEVIIRHSHGAPLFLSVVFSSIYSKDNQLDHYLCSMNDITSLKTFEVSLKQKNREQQETIRKLEDAQNLLLQSEKMASIG